MGLVEELTEIVASVVETAGAHLFDLEYRGGSVIVLANEPVGISLDRLTELSRAISVALDDADVLPGAYVLEVSSPGIERNLRRPGHFDGALGENVAVKTTSEIDGERRHSGVLISVGDDAIELAVKTGGAVHSPRHIPFASIERARTIFEWGPAPKPGQPGSKLAKKKTGPVAHEAEPILDDSSPDGPTFDELAFDELAFDESSDEAFSYPTQAAS